MLNFWVGGAESMYEHVLCFGLVALIWGATNPLLRRGGAGIERVRAANRLLRLLAELRFLATTPRYFLPFLANQAGSVLYYLTIARADISLAVPITNSLTFVATTLVGRALGEPAPSHRTYAGMVVVSCGVTLCVVSKLM